MNARRRVDAAIAEAERRLVRAGRFRAALSMAAMLLVGVLVGQLPRLQQAATDEAQPVRLTFRASDVGQVAVAGSWNQWNPEPMTRNADVFEAVVLVPPGRHEYMFVVDGTRWVTDPTAALVRDDGFGNKNAVLEL